MNSTHLQETAWTNPTNGWRPWLVCANLSINGDGTREIHEARVSRFHAPDHEAACDYVRNNYTGAVAAIIPCTADALTCIKSSAYHSTITLP